MTARLLILLSIIAIAGALAAPTAPLTAAPAEAGKAAAAAPFTIDSVHSTIIYRLRHFGVSYFYGRINKPSGAFVIDPDDLASSSIEIAIEIANMDAGNDDRNRFLLSPDFFNVREHPKALFASTVVRRLEDGAYEADGLFTMHGVTKEITVRLDEYTERRTERFGYRAGFECTFTVSRSAYGMDLFVEDGTLGDDVRITAAIEGVRE